MNSIIIISEEFPYGGGEVFLEKELNHFCRKFDAIYLFPLNKKGAEQRKTPENCSVHLDLCELNQGAKLSNFQNLSSFIRALWIELVVGKKISCFKKKFKYNLSVLKNGIYLCNTLYEFMLKHKLQSLQCYSVWNNKGALLFSLLKAQKKIPSFTFRFHGYDLFDERHDDLYIPFRFLNLYHSKEVHLLSKAGLNYIAGKEPRFMNKYKLSYFGVYDKGINPLNKDAVFTLVSCSNVISLKRVELIVESLKHITFPLRWVHFGTGENYEKVSHSVVGLNLTTQVELKGQTPNEVVIDFYKNTSVSLFIHLSETEGLGVALIEAISFGIPVMGCDTGGVPEIVNDQTGILLPVEVTPEEVADKIATFRDSELNSVEFRKGIRNFWRANFDAEKLYDEFVQTMLSK